MINQPYPLLFKGDLPDIRSNLDVLAFLHDEVCRTSNIFDVMPEDDYCNDAIRSLYFVLTEIAGAIVILLATHRFYSTPVLMRQALEAYVDMGILLDDDTYFWQLRAADLTEWKKLNTAMSTGKNAMFGAVKDRAGFARMRKYVSNELKKTHAGIERPGIEARFKRANLENVFGSVYTYFTSFSHNNFMAQDDMQLTQIGNSFSRTLYCSTGKWALEKFPNNLARYLYDAAAAVHKRFSPSHIVPERMSAAFDKLQWDVRAS